MRVKVSIYYPGLQEYINKEDIIRVDGSTVGECLDDLIGQFPGVENWLFNEQRQLLDNIFVYINTEGAQKAALSETVKNGDELIIAAMIMGG